LAARRWTGGSDTDIISYTNYNADSTVASTVSNYVDGVFTATQPITDTITQYSYDPLGRLTQTVLNADPATLGTRTDTNRTATYQYDPTTGWLVGEQDALGRWTNTQYDGLGRAITVTADCTTSSGTPVATGCAAASGTYPDRNAATSTRYDALGRAYETVDALGRVTHTDYDGVGRPVDVIAHYLAAGHVTSDTNVKTQTAYDGLGEVLSTTDADGNTTSYSYDGLGDRVSSTDPMSRTSQMGYDGTGTLRWQATPDGRVTVYQVDGLGRVVATIENYHTGSSSAPDQDLTTQTVYDVAGRVAQRIDPAGMVTAYSRDLLDRPTSVTENYVPSGGTCSTPPCNVSTLYQCDRVGNRVAVTDPNGHMRQYAYDAANEQTSAGDALGRTTGYSYDLGGRLVGTTDPRGTADNLTYSYDGLDRLVQTSATNLPHAIQASYDVLGERLTLTDGTGTTTFSYDGLGRITQVAAPTTGTVGYGYDANGQRTSLTYPDGTALAYQYWPDGQPQTVSQSGNTLASYDYDTAGRLQSIARLKGRRAHIAMMGRTG
jgi:YD repeat-containing protein